MKRFRLKEKFRAAVMSGVAAFCLTTGCTPSLPEEQPPERQKTEWVANPNGREILPQQDGGGSYAQNSPDGRQGQTPLLPAPKNKDVLPGREHPADRSDPAPAIEKDTVKAEIVPTLPPQLAPTTTPLDIKPAYTPLQTAPLQLGLPKKEETKWKFKFYASHAFTHYFPTDITMKTTRYDVKIKDYEWKERGSREYFNPKNWFRDGHNPAQIFDEPTNAYTITMEKNAHILFVSAFHPKFYHDTHQTKYMVGTIDGVPVNGFAPVNKPFDGYNQSPGEMELVRNENTYRQMEYEIGYAHRFNLLSSKKFGTISYIPGISAGFQMGSTISVVIQQDKWWDFDDYHEKTKIQGIGGSLRSKIEWTGPRERFGIFYETKAALYHRKHGLLDGTQEYNLRYTSNNFGMTFMLYNPNRHKSDGAPKL